jgi:site-specific DNA-methyltransferase (adenine-specific)
MTKRQKEILDFVQQNTMQNGYAPSLEEIRKRFKLASVSTVHFHVTRLKESGYLDKIENKARSISVSSFSKELTNQSSLLLEKEPILSNIETENFVPNTIIHGDCINGLKKIHSNSIDGCITDPPYNYEFIGHKWDHEEITRRTERVQNSNTLIKHIPYGSGLAGGVRNERWYKKNADNINDYHDWCFSWGKEVYRVLKPGAYVMVFNSSRTIAHVQVALEKAGFYARDIIVWKKNSGIPKGLNFVKKLEKEGIANSKEWEGWHSCFRNEWEAIVLLQKPLVNNYLETIKEYGVGLLHTKLSPEGSFQSNIISDIKREKKEKFNIHCTIKPTELIIKLIDLIIPPGKNKVVLDPFMGSGTTAIAAIKKEVSYFGYEIDKSYLEIANKRIKGLR